jgi:WD40 repeat protein
MMPRLSLLLGLILLLGSAAQASAAEELNLATRRCVLKIDQENEYDATSSSPVSMRKRIFWPLSMSGNRWATPRSRRQSSCNSCGCSSASRPRKSWIALRLLTLTGHQEMISAVIFSPNGKQVITGSADDTIRVCDAAHGC